MRWLPQALGCQGCGLIKAGRTVPTAEKRGYHVSPGTSTIERLLVRTRIHADTHTRAKHTYRYQLLWLHSYTVYVRVRGFGLMNATGIFVLPLILDFK